MSRTSTWHACRAAGALASCPGSGRCCLAAAARASLHRDQAVRIAQGWTEGPRGRARATKATNLLGCVRGSGGLWCRGRTAGPTAATLPTVTARVGDHALHKNSSIMTVTQGKPVSG
jgi:hypothetical protein